MQLDIKVISPVYSVQVSLVNFSGNSWNFNAPVKVSWQKMPPFFNVQLKAFNNCYELATCS